MNYRQFSTWTAVLLAVVVALSATGVNASVVVNADLERAGDTTFVGTGAAPDAGTVWNSVQVGGFTDLLDSTGVATTIDVTFFGWTYNPQYFDYSGANDLMVERLIAADGATARIDFAGLTPGGFYDLYHYSSYWDATFKAPLLPAETATGDTKTTAWVEGDQYVLLQGAQAAGDGTLSVTVTSTLGSDSTWTVGAGFQVVEAAPIPEPSSIIIWSLIGVVALTFGWYRQRKTA